MERFQCNSGCSHNNKGQCVRSVPIFNHLESEQMDRIGRSAKTVELKKGEMLFREGEKDDTLYVIHTGKVRIFKLSEAGKEQTVRILSPGDFIGELDIFQIGEVHENYAEALQNSSICLIRQADLLGYLVEFPQISLKIIAEMASRLKEAEKKMLQVSTESVEHRIISFLVDCLDKNSDNSLTIKLPISKKDLASFLGTTPETISRRFRSLEEEGLIEQLPKNNIKIIDLDRLLLYGK